MIAYAKRLFVAPMAVLAQAAGAASMPFFASLWAKENHYEFATKVADSVSRVVCLGLLAASAMMVLGRSAIEFLFVGGKFSVADAGQCAAYFAVFSLSMFLWSAQAIYSRAFYAAGNTMVPMIAGTAVTAVAIPIYAGLFHSIGAMGLVIASDLGIAMQTLTIALLLHKRRMVSLASLDYRELWRCLMAAVGAGCVVWGALALLRFGAAHLGTGHAFHGRVANLGILVAGTAAWLAVVFQILQRSGSALPRATLRRLKLSA